MVVASFRLHASTDAGHGPAPYASRPCGVVPFHRQNRIQSTGGSDKVNMTRVPPLAPGGSPSAVVNSAAGIIIAALIVLGLYEGRDLLIPLAVAGILSFILFPLVRRLGDWG